MEHVDAKGNQYGRHAEQNAEDGEYGREDDEELETDPRPSGGAVAGPDGRDRGVAAQDYLKEHKLQAGADIEHHQRDEQPYEADDQQEGQQNGGDVAGEGLHLTGGAEVEVEAAAHLREEGNRTDLEQQLPAARLPEELAGVVPGGRDGGGGGESLHAAPEVGGALEKTTALR